MCSWLLGHSSVARYGARLRLFVFQHAQRAPPEIIYCPRRRDHPSPDSEHAISTNPMPISHSERHEAPCVEDLQHVLVTANLLCLVQSNISTPHLPAPPHLPLPTCRCDRQVAQATMFSTRAACSCPYRPWSTTPVFLSPTYLPPHVARPMCRCARPWEWATVSGRRAASRSTLPSCSTSLATSSLAWCSC